jgi:hypothetical protein
VRTVRNIEPSSKREYSKEYRYSKSDFSKTCQYIKSDFSKK